MKRDEKVLVKMAAGGCFANFDDSAKECKTCFVADQCSKEVARRNAYEDTEAKAIAKVVDSEVELKYPEEQKKAETAALFEKSDKKCKGCGLTKSLDEFYNNKRQKDGKQYSCKQCLKKYNEENREKLKESQKRWRRDNKGKIKVKCKKYYEENKELLKKKREPNKKAANARSKKWAEKNGSWREHLSKLKKAANERMNEAILWGEINGRRPLTSSKDKEERSLGSFLAAARAARKGKGGGSTFHDFWIDMTESHPMPHVQSYIKVREKKASKVEEISPELEKEILEELSEVNQTSSTEGNIFQPIFETMKEHFIEEPEEEEDLEFDDSEEEEVSIDESPIKSAESEYSKLKGDMSNEEMLKLAKMILEKQNEIEMEESINVVKDICDVAIGKLFLRVEHLYFT